MPELRVLLVDDEPLVRQGIRDFLEREPDVTIVGECGNGVEALETIARERVDIVFLDIQMPELDGLGVASALAEQNGPVIVFVTAYNEHAVRAFEVNAVDYVLKPFDRERFSAALARAKARRASGEHEELSRRLTAWSSPSWSARGARHSGCWSARMEDPVRAGGGHRLDRGGGQLRPAARRRRATPRAGDHGEPRGAAGRRAFARIHRSAIVNIARIRELQPTFNGEYAVFLHSGAKLTLSRGYRDSLRERLGGDW